MPNQPAMQNESAYFRFADRFGIPALMPLGIFFIVIGCVWGFFNPEAAPFIGVGAISILLWFVFRKIAKPS